VVALDDQFHGIPQGREFLYTKSGPPDEAHFQESLAHRTLGLNTNNFSLIPWLEKT